MFCFALSDYHCFLLKSWYCIQCHDQQLLIVVFEEIRIGLNIMVYNIVIFFFFVCNSILEMIFWRLQSVLELDVSFIFLTFPPIEDKTCMLNGRLVIWRTYCFSNQWFSEISPQWGEILLQIGLESFLMTNEVRLQSSLE